MEKQSFDAHVKELKSRLFHSAVVFVVLSSVSLYFSGDILHWLQSDLGFGLHALRAYDVFYTQLMISFLLGFFLSMPVIIYQALRFLKPGLKEPEYRIIRNYLPVSVVLFFTGSLFAYEYIVKASLQFFQEVTTSSSVTAIWGLKSTLGFALKISAFTGAAFQLPIACAILARAGLLQKQTLQNHRIYFIIGLLVIAALATPPDVVTQVLITVPVILLYELSVFIVGKLENQEDLE